MSFYCVAGGELGFFSGCVCVSSEACGFPMKRFARNPFGKVDHRAESMCATSF